MAHPEITWLSFQSARDSNPAARDPARPDQTQWCPVGPLSHH